MEQSDATQPVTGLDDRVVRPRGRAPIDQLWAAGRASAFPLQSDPIGGSRVPTATSPHHVARLILLTASDPNAE
jgi:hypothetical protein